MRPRFQIKSSQVFMVLRTNRRTGFLDQTKYSPKVNSNIFSAKNNTNFLNIYIFFNTFIMKSDINTTSSKWTPPCANSIRFREIFDHVLADIGRHHS